MHVLQGPPTEVAIATSAKRRPLIDSSRRGRSSGRPLPRRTAGHSRTSRGISRRRQTSRWWRLPTPSPGPAGPRLRLGCLWLPPLRRRWRLHQWVRIRCFQQLVLVGCQRRGLRLRLRTVRHRTGEGPVFRSYPERDWNRCCCLRRLPVEVWNDTRPPPHVGERWRAICRWRDISVRPGWRDNFVRPRC